MIRLRLAGVGADGGECLRKERLLKAPTVEVSVDSGEGIGARPLVGEAA